MIIPIKKFRSGFTSKTAVEDLNMNMYENQITGILGHNGAGKSTAIFMICGIFPPSTGTINVFNYNLKTHLNRVRPLIGFCPQQSILYDDLTVYEHLHIIASVS